MAVQLMRRLESGEVAVVHVVRFPQLSINHALLLFDFKETPESIEFVAYDPNNAHEPIRLRFGRGERRFLMPRTLYSPGGRVDVYEIYHAWNY